MEEAFERGRRVGRQEGLPFKGIPEREALLPGAQFEFEKSWFESYLRYERDVRCNLRRVQYLRWRAHRDELGAKGAVRRTGLVVIQLEEFEREIRKELHRVSEAVDIEREEGRGRGCVVAAMRARPRPPGTVRVYRSMAEFVAEDERRSVPDWPAHQDLGGADFGVGWSLEDPFRRWVTTRWRISWLCERNEFTDGEEQVHSDQGDATTEIYALEQPAKGATDAARVWLLGKLQTRTAVARALRELQIHAMHERNSLAAAADAVAAVSREEQESS